MTEREAVNQLKALAREHHCDLKEDSFYNVQYTHQFNDALVIGWDADSVRFLAFNKSPIDPPPDILQTFSRIDKVCVWPAGRDLSWLGWIRNATRMEIHHWNGEAMPTSWLCANTLTTLYLNSDSGQIPDSFRVFHCLEKLGLDSKSVLNLPDWIGELLSLKKLLMRNCRIRAIPSSLVKTGLPFHTGQNVESRSEESGIFIKNSELLDGDISLFSQPREVIDVYYHGEAMGQVRECKVIFLGDGNVGKTSLIDRIVNNQFQDDQTPTDGLEMTDWSANVEVNKELDEEGRLVNIIKWKTALSRTEGKTFTLRILDFGGQEIMHAMHRCFLTRHTVYVVVCDSRGDSEIDLTAARWLETVKSFAPDCPVILALNKADLNDKATVNERDLQSRYPSLRIVLRTSAKAEKGEPYYASNLADKIREAVPGCMDLSEASENWLNIKRELEDLETRKVPYIDEKRYKQICEDNHITDESTQRKMLERFKDLGVAYFYDTENFEPNNQGVRVLNPAWLTNGMYRLILRTPDNGFLSHKTIRETLKIHHPKDISDRSYTPEETEFILYVMRTFEISLHVKDGIEMIPMKMKKTPSKEAYNFPREDALHLRWKGAYLPNNLVHRLVIRKYEEIDAAFGEEAVWRSGGRFRQATTGCSALVEMNEQWLDVYVTGQASERRQYMESFRSEILKILEDMNLHPEETICFFMNGIEGQIAYRDVMEQYYRKEDQEIYLPGAQTYIAPRKLLQATYYDYESKFKAYQGQRKFQVGYRDMESSAEGAEAEARDSGNQQNRLEIMKTKWELLKTQMEVLTIPLPLLGTVFAFVLFKMNLIDLAAWIQALLRFFGLGGS